MYWSLYYKQILTQSFSQIFLCTSYLSYVKCHITPLYLKDNLKKRDWGRNCAEQFTIWYFSIKETRSRALNRVVTVTFDSALSVAPKVNGRPCSPESQAASLRGLCPPLLHHLCSPASHSGQVQRNGLLQILPQVLVSMSQFCQSPSPLSPTPKKYAFSILEPWTLNVWVKNSLAFLPTLKIYTEKTYLK